MKKETFTLQQYRYNEYKKIRTWLQKELIDCTNYVVIFVIINDYVHFFPQYRHMCLSLRIIFFY